MPLPSLAPLLRPVIGRVRAHRPVMVTALRKRELAMATLGAVLMGLGLSAVHPARSALDHTTGQGGLQVLDLDRVAPEAHPAEPLDLPVQPEPATPIAPVEAEAPSTVPPQPVLHETTVTVRRGDTLASILAQAGVHHTTTHRVAKALRPHFDPRDLKVGQVLTLTLGLGESSPLHGISLRTDPLTTVSVYVDPASGTAEASTDVLPTTLRPLVVEGSIDSSLYAAAGGKVPGSVLAEMVGLFSYDVDFQRDLRPGDSFAVMVNEQVAADGAVVDHSAITYAAMTLSGITYEVFRHTTSDGETAHYDRDGDSVRKALLRTPVNGARLSSGYGMRKHPILGYSRMHKGVDFAAPTGTPIYAAGDGVVEQAGWNGGYGKYVRIRHGGSFKTAYAHLSRLGKGVGTGRRVKQGQVIGYVGSTGRSTGPHLHYEILQNDRQVNPRKVRFPAGRKLTGDELAQFKKTVAATSKAYAGARTINLRTAAAD